MNHPFELKLSDLKEIELNFEELKPELAEKISGGTKGISETLTAVQWGEAGEGGGVTSASFAEEGGHYTTQSLKEEGGGYTTQSLKEEGGGYTTEAVGEEGGYELS